MTEQAEEIASEQAPVIVRPAHKPSQKRRKSSNVISHPREVTAAVTAQRQIINSKKDELAIAIRGMTELTQQLAASYAQQHVVIERLAQRVISLESGANGNGGNTSAASALASDAALDP